MSKDRWRYYVGLVLVVISMFGQSVWPPLLWLAIPALGFLVWEAWRLRVITIETEEDAFQADFWQERWKHQAGYTVRLRKALDDLLREYMYVRVNQGYAKEVVAAMAEVEQARAALQNSDERTQETPTA